MRKVILLLSWYFILKGWGYSTSYEVAGPFANEKQCNEIRKEIGSAAVSLCWNSQESSK